MADLTRRALAVCALSIVMLTVACRGAATSTTGSARSADARPNVVIFFTDDQGYGDLSCFGHPTIHTPHVDRLAARGMKLTQFYVASPVCSPSRTALLTGAYPKRVGMHEHVIFPDYDYGLHTDEVTLADLLSHAGYATGCFGKWHLGHRPGLLPTDQGFDSFYGVPYSNDMAQFHRKAGNSYGFRLPLMRDDEVLEWEPDQHLLTRNCTEQALAFIDAHADEPFFVYLPYSMPHIPIYASPEFSGRSPRGLYGDVIEEIDWSVGQVVHALEARGLTESTLIVFASDNGPWLQFKLEGGSAGLLRGGKGTNWEGGQRVPCLVQWPGVVPQGAVCRELVTAMDILPTVACLAGISLETRPARDGHDVSQLLRAAPDAVSPTSHFLYYSSKGELRGVRRGPWKLLFPPPPASDSDQPKVANGQGEPQPADQLYHVEHDVSERWNVASQHPDLVQELRALAEAHDARITSEARPVRVVEETVFDPRRPTQGDGEQ